jgi:hypothetical protein
VEVPSQGIAGWVSDWYVECSGTCPGRICWKRRKSSIVSV